MGIVEADCASLSQVSSVRLRRLTRRCVWGMNLVSGAGVVAATVTAVSRGCTMLVGVR